jgi:alkanesulfonate monooxygenase SsuD/methylene tetrahydromethanopterin reductase-like flavin-dependent oxidoreductase (luciferase family)
MIAVGFCLATFGTRYTQLREAARLIDELGFVSLHVWDHYVSWDNLDESVLEAWTTLAGLAEMTSRVRIGPMVANNLNRHPGRLAKVAATLHELSGGRCDLGIGSGAGGMEHESFGLVVGDAAERIARLAESLQIIPALWKGEPVTFHGQYYQLTEAIAAPAQNPPPRLIVAATVPESAQLAGRWGDGVNFPWVVRDRFPTWFSALKLGLAERNCDDFDCSLHARWSAVNGDVLGMLDEWEKMGFTRVVIYIEPPFPLSEIEGIAQRLRS